MSSKILKWFPRFSFKDLSMQQRLPLFICALLLCVVVSFSVISYLKVKNAALENGKGRLRGITEQLGGMFGQSAQGLITATRNAAGQETIKNFLRSGGSEPDSAALALLQKLRPDSTWVLVELLNISRAPILWSRVAGRYITVNRDSVISQLRVGPDSCKIGKLYTVRDSLYYPVVATVTDEKKIIGYLVRWRLQQTSPAALARFTQFLGTEATFYIGNADGTIWTDLIKPVPPPPANAETDGNYLEYSRPGAPPVIAVTQPVANTPWQVLIEFSRQNIMRDADKFLQWIIVIGLVLIIAGIIVASLMSRNITRPLNRLTASAAAITAGDYSQKVEVDRTDEIGKLAHAFNLMMDQINQSQQILERTIEDRTSQLEKANKELEAFSYSVSHDLRAPLRIIDGYIEILMSDYHNKLDDEAKRILNIITANVRKMGQLIDDLLNLSRLGRKELMVHHVDMARLVDSVIADQGISRDNHILIQTHDLVPADCDSSLIRQVWINLISNAIKYSRGREKPVIEISSSKTNGEVVYSIKDNGVGFDMAYSDKLFGVFQRLHKMTEYEGTGVGLALVHQIVTRHSGRVWAEAEVNKGATFYFSLPELQTTV